MKQKKKKSLTGQWLVVVLLVAALAGGLGYGLRQAMSPSRHIALPRWGGLSETDKTLATHAVQTLYQDLQHQSFADAAEGVTPPPPPDTVSRAATWMTQGLAQSPTAQTQFDACADQVQALGWAVEQWSTDNDDNGELPRSLADLVPTYFKTLPTCPSDPKAHYHYEFSHDSGQFTIYCDGCHHALAGAAPHSPEYSSTFGLSRLHGPDPTLKLVSFAVQGLVPDGQQAVATVQESWQVDDRTCATTSTLHVTPAGPSWKVVLPDGDPRPPGQALAGKGVGEAFLVALASEPHWFATASSAPDKLTTCSYNLQRLGAALDAWASDHEGEYPSRLADLVPHYLRELPRCPVDGGSYADGYEARGTDYSLCCAGGRHVGCNAPNGYPRIDNTTGLLLNATTAAAGRPQAEVPADVHVSAR